MEVTILNEKEFHVVGFKREYRFDEDTRRLIPQLWDYYLSRQKEIDLWVEHVSLGICYEGTEKGFRYFVGGVVPSFPTTLPNGMEKLIIPSQRYARFTCKGKADKIGEHWDNIHVWFTDHPVYERSGLDFEYYDERFNPQSDDAELDIFISIK